MKNIMVNNSKIDLIPVTQIQTLNLDDQMILLRACSLTKYRNKIFAKIAQKFFFLQKSPITPREEANIE